MQRETCWWIDLGEIHGFALVERIILSILIIVFVVLVWNINRNNLKSIKNKTPKNLVPEVKASLIVLQARSQDSVRRSVWFCGFSSRRRSIRFGFGEFKSWLGQCFIELFLERDGAHYPAGITPNLQQCLVGLFVSEVTSSWKRCQNLTSPCRASSVTTWSMLFTSSVGCWRCGRVLQTDTLVDFILFFSFSLIRTLFISLLIGLSKYTIRK